MYSDGSEEGCFFPFPEGSFLKFRAIEIRTKGSSSRFGSFFFLSQEDSRKTFHIMRWHRSRWRAPEMKFLFSSEMRPVRTRGVWEKDEMAEGGSSVGHDTAFVCETETWFTPPLKCLIMKECTHAFQSPTFTRGIYYVTKKRFDMKVVTVCLSACSSCEAVREHRHKRKALSSCHIQHFTEPPYNPARHLSHSAFPIPTTVRLWPWAARWWQKERFVHFAMSPPKKDVSQRGIDAVFRDNPPEVNQSQALMIAVAEVLAENSELPW